MESLAEKGRKESAEGFTLDRIHSRMDVEARDERNCNQKDDETKKGKSVDTEIRSWLTGRNQCVSIM